MKKVTSIIILFLQFISVITFSQTNFQSGYIVTINNEKIQGSIDYRNWAISPRIIRFKKGENTIREYSVNELKEFSVADEKYISRTFLVDSSSSKYGAMSSTSKAENRTEKSFLRILVQGSSTLLLYKDENRHHYFMEEDTIKLVELLSKEFLANPHVLLPMEQYLTSINQYFTTKDQYKGQLKYYWRKYPTLYQQIDLLEYEEKSMINLFNSYEKLKGTHPYIEKPKKGVSYLFSLVGGVSQTNFKFESIINTTKPFEIAFDPTISPALGIGLEIVPFEEIATKRINHWTIYNEALYNRYSVEKLNTTYFLNQIETAELYKLDFSYLRLSSSFRFQTTGDKLKFFCGIGFSGSMLLKTNENLYNRKRYIFNTTNFSESNTAIIESLTSFEPGYLVSLGLKFNRISFQLRYENSFGMSGRTDLINPTIKHLYILIGYRF
jgi:hypothetical protein